MNIDVDLIAKAKSGDADAITEITDKCLPILKSCCKRAMASSIEDDQVEDYLGVAWLGLHNAIELFDSSRGIKFETYLGIRVMGTLLDFLRDRSRMSRLQQTQAAIFERVEDKLTEVMQRKPRIHEIEWACRLKPGQSSYLHIVSLALRDSSSLADKVASTDNADHVELSAVLHDDCGIDPSEEAQARDLRTTLLDSSRNTRDRQVISDYLSGLSFVEVGKRHQISESRASQLVQRWRAIVKETWLKLTGEELDLSHCIKVKHGPIRHSKIKDHRVARKMPQIQPRELEELQSLAV